MTPVQRTPVSFPPRSPLSSVFALLTCGVLVGVLAAAAVFPLLAVGGFAAKQSIEKFDSLPGELTEANLPQTTKVYASDGETLIANFYEENREVIELDDVGDVMINALLAAEDTRFYEHEGVDWTGVLRAAVTNQTSEDSQGASTLTMQYVRNSLIYSASSIDDVIAASEPTMERKIREMRYALALEEELTKDEILERYLNVVFLGSQAYGVHAGAYTYFDKAPNELELHEAAFLAALPKYPSLASINAEADLSEPLSRRNWVLDRMADVEYITEAEATEAKEEPLGLNPQPTGNECVDTTHTDWGFFCDYFKQWWASNPQFGDTQWERLDLLKRGGFSITTSMDPDVQSKSMKTLASHIDVNNPTALGSVVVTPGTGHVQAMAVNRIYSLDQSNNGPHSNERLRSAGVDSNYPNTTIPLLSGNDETPGFPAGSTFKLYTMLAALEEGMPLATSLPSPHTYHSRVYTVHEEGRASCSQVNPGQYVWCPSNDNPSMTQSSMDMWDAYGRSSNTYFVQLQEFVGTSAAVEMAERAGINFRAEEGVVEARNNENQELDEYGMFTLGLDSTTPLDMANAYATVASGGIKCDPMPVLKIHRSDGSFWEDASEPSCERVIEEDVALAAVSAGRCPVGQSDDVSRCSGGTATGEGSSFDRPLMGKTGTADRNRSYWMMLATPNAASATFVGDPDMSSRSVNANSAWSSQVRSSGITVLGHAVSKLDVEDWDTPSNDLVRGKDLTSIPNIGCVNVNTAINTIENAGFNAVVAQGQHDSSCDQGQAFSTTPTGTAPKGTNVFILISNGEDQDDHEDDDDEDDDDEDDDDEDEDDDDD
ncbi:transglycosylase domain-containing protein [Natronoglycomyces albus]|uniref:Penicillin-binding protein n=1 Tax=Natronoglycomyces albus TaxID=2811108 RepID=A0A895XQY9_9ACTN|nr:transglycosylase domain-containing protein [Natronoglycomyces albus]QSB05575.1 penicillin-binding protein [Natronoglycomyces albus]